VITTDKASIPEVVGNGGIMVKDINPIIFAEKIRLLEHDTFRHTLISCGFIQSKKFNLDKCFQETINFYGDCFEKKIKALK
jgi:glycosyltransferase involved in cell wall biosynthesis